MDKTSGNIKAMIRSPAVAEKADCTAYDIWYSCIALSRMQKCRNFAVGLLRLCF